MSNWRPGFGNRLLAPYACDATRSRGRQVAERESEFRSPFQRDRDRVVHSTAFRRLEHKTQVFVNDERDHFRSRLTHTLEVAQIARTAARVLGLDEDLAEAVALAHDLGHSPFGHAGEAALDQVMAPFGGFDHNAQTLRVITRLERRYAAFDGLNLTFETLEGVIKHNGPLAGDPRADVAEVATRHGIDLAGFASAEAQVAALADDIAYVNHDLDDGLRAGLFTIADLADLPLVGPTFVEVAGRWPGLEPRRLRHESLRRLIHAMVVDLVRESEARLTLHAPADSDALRRLETPVIAFSDAMATTLEGLRRYLHAHMYSHASVRRTALKAQAAVQALFAAFLERPERLPPRWRAQAGGPGEPRSALAIADYIAGMTDRYALEEHDRLAKFMNGER